MKELMFTKEQVDILLLQQSQSVLGESLSRIESHMNSQFLWIMGSIFGLYGIVVVGLISALCKAFNLF